MNWTRKDDDDDDDDDDDLLYKFHSTLWFYFGTEMFFTFASQKVQRPQKQSNVGEGEAVGGERLLCLVADWFFKAD